MTSQTGSHPARPLPGRATSRATSLAGLIGFALLLVAAALLARAAAHLVPPAYWLDALRDPAPGQMATLLLRDALLPRFVVSLAAGAALGLSGTLFQQVLRNPLAEPGTLAVFSGAKLAVMAATLFAPVLLTFGPEGAALLGGLSSFGAVALLGARRGFAPLVLILGGLVVTFVCDGLAQALLLFHHEALTDVLVWQSGSLSQNSWEPALALSGVLALGALATIPLIRALTALELDENGAQSLGVAVAPLRLAALMLAVGLAVAVICAVGAIGFIGLAGPALARAAGAVTLRQRLWQAPLMAAALLALTDQLVQMLLGGAMPTGAVTAVLGAPLLLFLLRRVRAGHVAAPILAAAPPARGTGAWPLLLLAGGLAALTLVALGLGRAPGGWALVTGEDFTAMFHWRGPRVAGAAAAGALFAIAGQILQRATGNPLASPELLGVSAGAGLGLLAVLFLAPAVTPGLMLGATSLGAGAVLAIMVALARRASLAGESLLLAGVALTALLSAIGAVVLFTGDPRTIILLEWLSGSTYGVTLSQAAQAGGVLLAVLLALPLLRRWLEIVPLGRPLGRALGLGGSVSPLLLAVAAVATAAGTLMVGPLSFAGLMAPHMARLMGLNRPLPQAIAAALIGALLMVLADFLGRTLAFPWQMPAGLVASLIGGGYVLWLLWRRPA
ncbi:Fe3+-hydroxamate ABC transporter permease FhuB [Azorhizobium oxalatiphilum]|uniref:Fe3+-hydroxamate ABC transporter permease FhuB n=1 Tax=Azorhizobium oxalatiphilum TaxID=980631 RepID=A0A917BVV9_9HYPH|nr:Fe(3+)-hydroxamate ABC transporter permease FhuB [Azorhizobium oxalatiphilum]GGF58283.1 Fe3+-hydroxamate ABC transporter permease FhuB [Azorhizobium oxalatiphilum]